METKSEAVVADQALDSRARRETRTRRMGELLYYVALFRRSNQPEFRKLVALLQCALRDSDRLNDIERLAEFGGVPTSIVNVLKDS